MARPEGSAILRMSPSTASQLAEGSVAFVHKKFGFVLPYTPESLIMVDAVVEKIKATGATEQQASGLLSGLGCYVGEVFVRHAKASWRWTAEMGMTKSCRFPVVLALPGVIGCDPIGRVFERFSGGAAQGVALLYEAAVAPAPLANDPTRGATPPADRLPSRAAPAASRPRARRAPSALTPSRRSAGRSR